VSEHYYTRRPTAEHGRKTVEAVLRGRSYTFVTDAGVFSRDGVDFGSRLLIEHVALPEHARVLDMGCGWGPIGISLSRLVPRGSVTMADVNERAVELARENARRNGAGSIEIVQSDLFDALAGRSFTHIVTNPPIRAGKEIVHRLFEQAADHLEDGGKLWIVIQKKQGAPSAKRKLETIYADVREVTRAKGYSVICASKNG
jgi:16S rRNA (guanine1207-N2)-methyltransferase